MLLVSTTGQSCSTARDFKRAETLLCHQTLQAVLKDQKKFRATPRIWETDKASLQEQDPSKDCTSTYPHERSLIGKFPSRTPKDILTSPDILSEIISSLENPQKFPSSIVESQRHNGFTKGATLF